MTSTNTKGIWHDTVHMLNTSVGNTCNAEYAMHVLGNAQLLTHQDLGFYLSLTQRYISPVIQPLFYSCRLIGLPCRCFC